MGCSLERVHWRNFEILAAPMAEHSIIVNAILNFNQVVTSDRELSSYVSRAARWLARFLYSKFYAVAIGPGIGHVQGTDHKRQSD